MIKRTFDKKFIDFPLSCLIFLKDDVNKLKELLHFYVIEKALKMDPSDENIEAIINDNPDLKLPEDFDGTDGIHLRIIQISNELGIRIETLEITMNMWLEIKEFIHSYELKYGKDSYCRIGKQLLIDAAEKTFPLREFKVLCAIQSVLGKKKSIVRITYDRLSYCMLGYKKKSIAMTEGAYQQRLSNRQIAISVEKLRDKRLITSVTYFREKYYSTRIKSNEKLREIIARKKFSSAERMKNVQDKEWAKIVQREVKRIRKSSTSNKYYLDGTLTA